MKFYFLNFYTSQYVLTKNRSLPDHPDQDTWYLPIFFDNLDIYLQCRMYSRNDHRHKPNAVRHQESTNILDNRFQFPYLSSI